MHEMWAGLWKSLFLKKFCIEEPHDSAALFLSAPPPRTEDTASDHSVYTHVNSSSSHNTQSVDTALLCIDEWTHKQNAVHPYNGIRFCSERESTSQMNLEGVMLSERSQRPKALSCMIPRQCDMQSKFRTQTGGCQGPKEGEQRVAAS